MRRLAKPLLALTAGLALLFLSAMPTSATAGTVNSGTLSVNLIPALSVTLGGTGCSGTTVDVTTSSATPPNATTTLSFSNAGFDYNGGRYVLHGVTAATATNGGSVTSGTNTSVSTGTFTTSGSGNIYPATTPTGCTPDLTTPLCAGIGLTAPLLSLSGTFTGTSFPLSGTAVVSGSGRVDANGCSAPFSTLDNRTLTVTNLNVSF